MMFFLFRAWPIFVAVGIGIPVIRLVKCATVIISKLESPIVDAVESVQKLIQRLDSTILKIDDTIETLNTKMNQIDVPSINKDVTDVSDDVKRLIHTLTKTSEEAHVLIKRFEIFPGWNDIEWAGKQTGNAIVNCCGLRKNINKKHNFTLGLYSV